MGIDVYLKLIVNEGETPDDAVADFLNKCQRWGNKRLSYFYAEDVRAFRLIDRMYRASANYSHDAEAGVLLAQTFKEGDDAGLALHRIVREHILFHLHLFSDDAILQVGRLHSLLPHLRLAEDEYVGDIATHDIGTILTNLQVEWNAWARIERAYYG